MFATKEDPFGSDRRKGLPLPTPGKGSVPQVSQQRKHASAATANNGLTISGLGSEMATKGTKGAGRRPR